MKKLMGIAVVAMLMAGSMAFAEDSATTNKQDKATCTNTCCGAATSGCPMAKKQCPACTAEKKCDACTKKAAEAKKDAEAKDTDSADTAG